MCMFWEVSIKLNISWELKLTLGKVPLKYLWFHTMAIFKTVVYLGPSFWNSSLLFLESDSKLCGGDLSEAVAASVTQFWCFPFMVWRSPKCKTKWICWGEKRVGSPDMTTTKQGSRAIWETQRSSSLVALGLPRMLLYSAYIQSHLHMQKLNKPAALLLVFFPKCA